MAQVAINAALIAAAARQEAATKAILKQLNDARANQSRGAVTLDLSAQASAAALARLIKSGHVREAGGGAYWLDEEAVARGKAAGVRLAWIVAAFLLSAGASLAALAAAY